jgi:hypothetical protein
MLKNVFLAAAATLILAAATVPVASTPALACHGCWKAAKAAGVKCMKALSQSFQGIRGGPRGSLYLWASPATECVTRLPQKKLISPLLLPRGLAEPSSPRAVEPLLQWRQRISKEPNGES